MNIFDKITNKKTENNIGLLHMNVEFFALYLNNLFYQKNKPILVVTSNLYEASKINNSLSNYNDCLFFQTDDVITDEAIAISPELKLERLGILRELIKNNKRIVITDINGYLKLLPDKNILKNSFIKIEKGKTIEREYLLQTLYKYGYNKEVIVTSPGEIGVRGFVVDIYPVNNNEPIRIEFFDNEIESIRYFDIDSQRSTKEIDSFNIFPFTEQISNNNSSLYEYLKSPIVIFKDYNQVEIGYQRLINDITEFAKEKEKKHIYTLDEIKPTEIQYFLDLDSVVKEKKLNYIIDYQVKEAPHLNEDIDKINKYLKECISDKKTVILCLDIKKLNLFLKSLTISYILTKEDEIKENTVNIISKKMNMGFCIKNYVFLTENELFNHKNDIKRKKNNFKFATRIKDLNKLEIGDYVVHNIHGIGIYNGIKTIENNGLKNDYLEVLYDKNDKLYIPASKIELISKYSSKEGFVPKINSLNSLSWEKTKNRVKEKIRYEAERLLKVQAERNTKKGFSFAKDIEEQIIFENEFEYEMTNDQLSVTDQIKKDMESSIPMDRILCGDVGYGKTEVAFRAIFKAVCSSKQVMYLCPTTLLSKQQYENAIGRFRNFPVQIGLLNRFVTGSKAEKIISDFKNGKIDILFGTHRILSSDVIPNDLGLLVVDEEQRFGVAHKEKIKEFKSNIDILTLTATPIPRTLQMSLLGIRNLSLIETPPKNRHSVQTYVMPEDKRMVREIIYKELSRNGQTFILYNKVSDIEEKVKEIERLVPDAKITFAHGQMSKKELEDRMQEFIEKKYDCLVCTTIIETGIDIPNTNSLIVFDADRFGLSQLYQIRGRVGRSDRIAYAYLMYNKNKMLNEVAIKRLKVIKEFTELGSGFSIATRDLSIRGAGDILGAEQAGFIDSVGIDLYMKMLSNEILKLRGLEVPSLEEEDNKDIIKVSNHIKDKYVEDQELKIEIHKLINTITTSEELNSIKKEIEDRFGIIDIDMYNYMNEELFANLLKKQGVEQITDNNKYIELIFDKEKSKNIDYQDFFVKSIDISNNFKFQYKKDKLYLKLIKNGLTKHPLIYLNNLLGKM